MSNKNTRAEKLKILFATHPKTDTFFLTSDDKAFFDNGAAGAHASTLKDKKVQSYSRKRVSADEELEKAIARNKADEAKAKAEAEAEKKAADAKASEAKTPASETETAPSEETAPAKEAAQEPTKSSSKPKSK